MKNLSRPLLYRWLLLQGLVSSLAAQSAPPDVGDVLRNAGAKQLVPPPVAGKVVLPAPTETRPEVPGGPTVLVRDISVVGNSVFTTQELKAVVADQLGLRLDMAGMKALARRISDHYRQNGYQFARAVVRVQEFRDDTLQVTVLEGRYGTVKLVAEPAIITGAEPFFVGLRPGDLLESGRLERTMLIFDGNPGIVVMPSVSPGAALGTSDLEISIRMDALYGGDVGVDNAGSRYTGYYRTHVSWYRNGLACFGDRLAALVMVTDQGMVLGSLDYEMPLDGRGLRWKTGFSRTTYSLGKEYAALDATGLANVWSTGLSYPLVRSQSTNLSLAAGVQHKDLQDDFAAVLTHEAKSTLSLPLVLRYDHRDGLFGGAVSYGTLGYTVGRLSLDDALAATDASTARKAGTYGKANFDLARIQSFTSDLSAYARFSAQWSSGNLDSSERLGVGGFEGVRAYPVGEASADAGWVAQLELRYVIGDYAPYLLYDAGYARINQHPWDAGSDQSRNLSGAGLGVRYVHDLWSGNLTISWRLDGGAPTQDTGETNYRIAFALSRNF
jgi:hemolysin activation/secretion protein